MTHRKVNINTNESRLWIIRTSDLDEKRYENEMPYVEEAEQELIHRKYIRELLKNQFLPSTRTEILTIAQRMKDEDGIEARHGRRSGGR